MTSFCPALQSVIHINTTAAGGSYVYCTELGTGYATIFKRCDNAPTWYDFNDILVHVHCTVCH